MRLTSMAMRVSMLAMSGCTWQPAAMTYPSGLTIVRLDPSVINQACTGKNWDNGMPRNGRSAAGCYSKATDTIYIQNNCEGAKALTHEWAHKEGVAEPSKEGFDW